MLYTDAANNAVASIVNTATLAISQINDALGNSNIYSNLNIDLASIRSLNFSESGDIEVDVESLSEDNTAQNLRDTHEADLVVLLTDGNYGSIAGIVDEIGPDNNDAYSIVQAVHATPNYTFTHEVGHLFGGCHQNDYTNGTAYEHGYLFKTGLWPFKKTRTTLMHTYDLNFWGNSTRELNYSNPDVEIKNEPTGTNSDNDVARKIREEAQTVEAFRDYTPPLSVYISGPSKGDNTHTYTWYANVDNGVPPYSYLWEYSLDGINYNGTMGTSSSITAPLPYDSDLHLKLTVSSSDSQTDIAYHTTINLDAGFKDPVLKSSVDSSTSTDSTEKPEEKEKKNTLNKTNDNKLIQNVFPNPAHDVSTIQYNIYEDAVVFIKIINMQGQVVKTLLRENQKKGFYYRSFNISDIENGSYFIHLQAGEKKESKNIIIK